MRTHFRFVSLLQSSMRPILLLKKKMKEPTVYFFHETTFAEYGFCTRMYVDFFHAITFLLNMYVIYFHPIAFAAFFLCFHAITSLWGYSEMLSSYLQQLRCTSQKEVDCRDLFSYRNIHVRITRRSCEVSGL